MKREAKEMRLVYRDFLLDVNQSHPEVVALEADLSSSMGTNNLGKHLVCDTLMVESWNHGIRNG